LGAEQGRTTFKTHISTNCGSPLCSWGRRGSPGERTQLALNIGKGAVLAYTWRTINLLARLVPTYIRWPHSVEHPVQSGHRVFSRCIGFLDGTNIVLRNEPTIDPEAYFSRKKNYGFNLQAWEGRFIWVSMKHTAFPGALKAAVAPTDSNSEAL